MRGLFVLSAAIGACALIVWFGPATAERLVPLLGGFQQSMAAVETLYTVVIFGALLLVALAGGTLCKLNPFRMGEHRAAMLILGALAGAAGILAATLYARLAGSLDPGVATPGFVVTILWGSLVILFAAAVEEIYFRGWLQPVLARDYGLPVALLLSSLAFAALHVMGGARSPTTLANLFLGGLVFGLLAARGGGLAGAIAAHFTWNWTEQIALGLDPNPGMGSFGALADLELTGPAIWGGSDEGLNASIAMTVALFALLVPLLIWARDSLVPISAGSRPAPAE
ncbi:MAG TPA: CPBP family intramembrane glutamic endopeptidase [Allosphingosinicella sp.]|jgi:hypothetical protein|uniref:CPBP family intramembrane glutamic endopeptidase n=1 Tax=Allosphingosinicella sp. TaxID=2823234 RepID=UPI002F29A882